MEVFIIIILLAIAAETTYLSATTFRKSQRTTLAPVFVDTSVLIDGRIIAVAESGFLTRPLYIPRSVVGELQFLADNADPEKRSRARHGLDIINQLQSITSVQTVIFADGVRAEEGVDNRLLSLAKKHSGAVCTIDYNLNKVAVVEGIEVLNVNELAKSLRMAYLPGERIRIELTQKGNDQHQAVGHLEDGTMVVVEHAYKQIGSIVEIEFIRSLQTAAGKMMFAKLTASAKPQQKTSKAAAQPPVRHAVAAQVQEEATKRRPQQKRSKGTAARPVSEKAPEAKSQDKKTEAPRNKPTQQRPRPQQRRQKRSPEDSLIELANKQ